MRQDFWRQDFYVPEFASKKKVILWIVFKNKVFFQKKVCCAKTRFFQKECFFKKTIFVIFFFKNVFFFNFQTNK